MGNSTEDLYDLAPESHPAAVRRPGVIPQAVAVHPAPLAYRSPTTTAATKASEPEAIRYLYMPLWLLGGGIVVELVAELWRARDWRVGLTVVGIEVILGTAILLVGVLLAARWRAIDLGSSLPRAAMKLAAISVAPGALATLLSPMLDRLPIFGGLIGWAMSFVLYFALLGVFFDLDESDTWYCVWVIFLVRLALYFVLVFRVMPWVL